MRKSNIILLSLLFGSMFSTPLHPQPSSVPTIELREYIDLRFKEINKRIDIQFNQIKESTSLSLAQLDNRFDNTNEWRNTVSDMMATFATKDVLDSKTNSLNEDIKSLELTRASLEGKASQNLVNLNVAIATIALVIGIINMITKREGLSMMVRKENTKGDVS